MRAGESDGNPYFFRDEAYFDTARLCTHLWVNERFWTDGMPKWLYGVPEDEVYNNLGKNLIYDVIEPRYVRQMLDWFHQNKLSAQYNFRVAYFLSPEQNLETARARANMPNDADVRRTNTCNPIDFLRAGLDIDYILSPRNGLYNPRLAAHVKYLQKARWFFFARQNHHPRAYANGQCKDNNVL